MSSDDDAFWASYEAKRAARRSERLLTADDGEDSIRKALHRMARPLQVGGFRPTGLPSATCFGEVRLAAKGETWPHHNGTPMFPLAQINVAEAGMQSGPIADCALIAMFMSPDFNSAQHTLSKPQDEAGFAVRSYATLEGLAPVEPPAFESSLKPFECRWLELVDDYASHDLACDFVDGEHVNVYAYDWHKTCPLTKIGGWPATIQAEPWWMYRPEAPDMDYVLQISPEEKSGWYCDSLFLARGREDKDLWALDVQMF